MRALKIFLTGGFLLAFSAAAFPQDAAWDNLNREVLSLILKRDFSAARPKAQEALALAEKNYGKAHLRTGQSLNNLGFIELNLNQIPRSESLLTRAVEIFSNTPKTGRADYVQALNSLARIRLLRREPARAESLYIRAAAVSRRPPGIDSLGLAQSLNNLAGLYLQEQKLNPAESVCRLSLDIREKTTGGLQSPAALQTLDNLIYILARQEKYAAAETLAQRAAKMLAPSEPLHPLEAANYLNSWGTFCHLQGKFAKAESLFQRSLALRQRNLGPDDPQVIAALENLAEAKKSQKKYEGLDSLYERMAAALEKNSGPENAALAAKFDKIARFYESIGQAGTAKKWAAKAERVRPKTEPAGNQ